MPTKYPPKFLQNMKLLLEDDLEAFLEALNEAPPTSIRLNPAKRTPQFDGEQVVVWCPEGRYLETRPSFTLEPLFHAGTYYVQEASSMFIEAAWNQVNRSGRPAKVLDLCAAPGGKSTHLLSLLKEEDLLVSNEIIPRRNKILQQNIIKWGNANCVITQNNPKAFSELENFFDVVLVDAPCSGEGLFRK